MASLLDPILGSPSERKGIVHDLAEAWNAQIDSEIAGTPNVTIVDHFTEYSSTDHYESFDATHPNWLGAYYLASNWATALEPILSSDLNKTWNIMPFGDSITECCLPYRYFLWLLLRAMGHENFQLVGTGAMSVVPPATPASLEAVYTATHSGFTGKYGCSAKVLYETFAENAVSDTGADIVLYLGGNVELTGIEYVKLTIDLFKSENADVKVLVGKLMGGGAERSQPSECLVPVLMYCGISVASTLALCLLTYVVYRYFVARTPKR